VLVLHFSNYVRKYHKILSANPLRIEPTSTSTEGLNAECFIHGLRKIKIFSYVTDSNTSTAQQFTLAGIWLY